LELERTIKRASGLNRLAISASASRGTRRFCISFRRPAAAEAHSAWEPLEGIEAVGDGVIERLQRCGSEGGLVADADHGVDT
jgi:hypothetical protein